MAGANDYSPSSEFHPQPVQRIRTGSMSVGQNAPAPAELDTGASNGGGTGTTTAATAPSYGAEPSKQVQDVLQSEIGVSTMLNRLKQSIASAKEFAQFLNKRAQLEDHHSNGLRKVAKTTAEIMSRGDHLGGTFAQAYAETMLIHERMADNGYQFGMSLQQMCEDLQELAAIAEKNRKGWKQNGLAAEQRVVDFDTAMRKSRIKYDQLAEEYDRVRTGDTSGRRGFGFKGKSGAQHEEDLFRKVQAADQDYQAKVQALQHERSELINTTRPEAIRALQDIVRECDGGLALQVQKFASFNEKLLLSNGLSISPLKTAQKPDNRSLREIVTAINNEKDLDEYLSGYHSKVPPRSGEPKYERHPVLNNQYTASNPLNQMQNPVQPPTSSHQAPLTMNQRTNTMGGYNDPQSPQGGFNPMPPPVMPAAQRPSTGHERSFSHGSAFGQSPVGQQPPQQQFNTRNSTQQPPTKFGTSGGSSQGPPQLGALPFQSSQPQPPPQPQSQNMPPQGMTGMTNPLMQNPIGPRPGSNGRNPSPPRMAPTKPVFGVSLARLYERDQLAVPMVVYQCIQAVNLFGLGVEGIYRLSGSVPHVNKLKGMFDTDSSSPQLDFRNPENFFQDVNSVAGLLKQFIRDLPEPLLTREHYGACIEAAKNEDEVVRRDSLHAIINSLPDPNYATLRALALHLHLVIDNAAVNRMNSQNLAIVFGPTLMGTGANSDIADAGWQVRVVETILNNTYQIFDDD